MSDRPVCPICRRPLPSGPEGQSFRPFCSRRCRTIDLGGWLDGAYRISESASDAEDEAALTQEGPDKGN